MAFQAEQGFGPVKTLPAVKEALPAFGFRRGEAFPWRFYVCSFFKKDGAKGESRALKRKKREMERGKERERGREEERRGDKEGGRKREGARRNGEERGVEGRRGRGGRGVGGEGENRREASEERGGV